MPKIYDKSPLIVESLADGPGDAPPRREILLDLARADSVTLSTLQWTVDLGVHADAHSHYRMSGPSIDYQPLEIDLGRCQVMALGMRRGLRSYS